MNEAYKENSPFSIKKIDRDALWLNSRLDDLWQHTPRLFSKARKNSNWDMYGENLTRYNHEIQKAVRSSWRRYFQGIEKMPYTARLQKILMGYSSCQLKPLILPWGEITVTTNEFLEHLMRVLFPCSELEYMNEGAVHESYLSGKPTFGVRIEYWNVASRIVTHSKIRYVINHFKQC